VIDAQERRLGIDTYLLLNPPLDLTYALETLDEWNALQVKFGRDRSTTLIARALAIVDAVSTEGRDDPAAFDRLTTEFAKFTREEIQFLFAKAMQTVLPELVYVTEVIHDRDGRPATKDEVRKRIHDANSVTFVDYAQRLAVPLWKQYEARPPTDLKLCPAGIIDADSEATAQQSTSTYRAQRGRCLDHEAIDPGPQAGPRGSGEGVPVRRTSRESVVLGQQELRVADVRGGVSPLGERGRRKARRSRPRNGGVEAAPLFRRLT